MGTPRTVGAYEAKTTLPALLDWVAQGHDIVITKHERPVARLVPYNRPAAPAEVFARVRALRGRLKLARHETASALIRAGRRI
jgi:prevent-host-death family protein